MNKHIQIIVLSSMLITISTMVPAERTIAHAAQHQIKTFTTAELNKKRTIIHDNHTTRSGSPVQTVGTQFTPLSVTDADVLLRAQPNCNGFVGPTQYLLNTNQSIRSFNKFTGQPDGIIDIDSATFLSVPMADARCAYDPWGQRWLVLAGLIDFTIESESTIVLAWSDGPIITPQTKWSLRVFTNAEVAVPEIPASTIDSPNLNTDQNAVYINMDIFPSTANPVFGPGSYVTALVIPQSSFVSGNPFTFTAFIGLFNSLEFPIVEGFAQTPTASNFDPNPQYGYIIAAPASETFGSGLTYDNFFMYRILNASTNSPTLFPAPPTVLNPIPPTPPISLAAPVYADTPHISHKGNLYGNFFMGYGRLQPSIPFDVGGIHVRNHQLYLIQTSAVDNTGTGSATGDRAAILWYQYDLTGDPTGQGMGTEMPGTVPVLIQSGVIFDPNITANPISYWNPSIMTNKNGDMAIIGNFAGRDNYVQAFYTGRKATDPLGQLRDITLLTNNTDAYNFGTLNYNDAVGQRWGDYCSLALDPINNLDIWATNQIVSGPSLWSILTTQLIPA
jgi:hypothetical protein